MFPPAEPLVHPVLMRKLSSAILIYAIISILAALMSVLSMTVNLYMSSVVTTNVGLTVWQWVTSGISVILNVLIIVALFRCSSACSHYASHAGTTEMVAALHRLDQYYLLILLSFALSLLNGFAMTVLL